MEGIEERNSSKIVPYSEKEKVETNLGQRSLPGEVCWNAGGIFQHKVEGQVSPCIEMPVNSH